MVHNVILIERSTIDQVRCDQVQNHGSQPPETNDTRNNAMLYSGVDNNRKDTCLGYKKIGYIYCFTQQTQQQIYENRIV